MKLEHQTERNNGDRDSETVVGRILEEIAKMEISKASTSLTRQRFVPRSRLDSVTKSAVQSYVEKKYSEKLNRNTSETKSLQSEFDIRVACINLLCCSDDNDVASESIGEEYSFCLGTDNDSDTQLPEASEILRLMQDEFTENVHG